MKSARTKNIIKLVVLSVCIIFLLVFSEALFILNHRGKKFFIVSYYVTSAKILALNNNPKYSLRYITDGADVIIHKNHESFGNIIPSDYSSKTHFPWDDEELAIAFNAYLKKTDLTAFSNKADMAQIFYNFALIALRNNKEENFVPLLKTAVNLNPELSHINIELANYYLAKGDKENAQNAIGFCLQFTPPKEFCNDYKYKNLNPGWPEPPGFLEEELADYYNLP